MARTVSSRWREGAARKDGMFEGICLREGSSFRPAGALLDIGALAEAMLFYQRVHVVGRANVIEHLARTCGVDVLLELVRDGYMSLEYYPDYPVVLTEDQGTPTERYLPTVVRIGHWELQNVLPEVLSKVTGATGRGRRAARRFEPYVKSFIHSPEVEVHSGLDCRDAPYLQTALDVVLHQLAPEHEHPKPLRIEIQEAGEGRIRLATNINFTAANAPYRKRVPRSNSSLSTAYLLAHIVSLRADLDTAAHFNAELSMTPISGELAKAKLGSILDRAEKSAARIGRFEDLIFDDVHAIREAINSGERSMGDFLEVLRKSGRFREWLKGREADADLVKEYYRAVTRDRWIERLPAKTTRFAVVSAFGAGLAALFAGPAGVIAGLGLGVADTFLLDRMARGWRPNQFVEGTLKEFISE